MEDRETLRKHAELFDGMAEALGIDVENAVMIGRMAFDDIAESVLRCVQCAHPGKCAALLAQERLEAAPGYCRNRSLLEDLQLRTA